MQPLTGRVQSENFSQKHKSRDLVDHGFWLFQKKFVPFNNASSFSEQIDKYNKRAEDQNGRNERQSAKVSAKRSKTEGRRNMRPEGKLCIFFKRAGSVQNAEG